MNERQVLIIKHSWSYILLQSEKTGDLFYQTLFQDFPSLEALFHNNMAAQTHKFMAMMTFMVARLQYPDEVEGEFHALAHRHMQYGVQLIDYDLIGHVLLKTLARILNERWTPETHDAWQTLYKTITNVMLDSIQERS
jgi:hemoglobin-like flavoprotein